MKSFKDKVNEFRKGLLRIHDREPLTALSLIVIIFLDLFILSIIFGGLDSHTRQLTSPEEYFPWVSRNVFIEKDWSKLSRIAQLQSLALVDYNRYSYTYENMLENNRIAKMHPKSRELFAKIKAIVDNGELKTLLVARQELVREMKKLNKDFKEHEPMYSADLLEQIGGAGPDAPALPTVTARLQDRKAQFEQSHAGLAQIDRRINEHPLVADLWRTIAPGNKAQRELIIKDIKRFELKYKFVELLWQLLFLLPIFIVFYIWHSRSVKRDHKIQILIASHLLVVAAIPLIGKAIELVIDLIPKYFFKKLFELLELLHIIALWHYFVIVIAIAVAILLIYLIQKKIFNREKLYRQRLERGQCYSCGKKLPGSGIKMCPFCGEGQLKACGTCSNETYIAGRRCIHCGAE